MSHNVCKCSLKGEFMSDLGKKRGIKAGSALFRVRDVMGDTFWEGDPVQRTRLQEFEADEIGDHLDPEGLQDAKAILTQNVRHLRWSRQFSWKTLAREVGISYDCLANHLYRSVYPLPETLYKLSKALGVPLHILMLARGGKEDPYISQILYKIFTARKCRGDLVRIVRRLVETTAPYIREEEKLVLRDEDPRFGFD